MSLDVGDGVENCLVFSGWNRVGLQTTIFFAAPNVNRKCLAQSSTPFPAIFLVVQESSTSRSQKLIPASMSSSQGFFSLAAKNSCALAKKS
jgi:hypothetical protein